jgi:hypothetical protein
MTYLRVAKRPLFGTDPVSEASDQMKTKQKMGRIPGLGAIAIAVLVSGLSVDQARSATSGLMAQAEAAIAAKDYFRATRLLTAIAAQKSNPDHIRAQELLATTREANGQLAQAVAEYDTYLKLYPDGEGAARVRARRAALLGGGAASDGSGTRGIVSLTYRMNDDGERPDYRFPPPGPFDKRFSALTAALQFQTVMPSANGRSRLVFSGSGDISSSGVPSRDPKISEAFFDYTWAANGATVTVGRFKPSPRGIGYRVDGAQLTYPLGDGVTVGLDAGKVVDSSRSDLFGDDRHLLAASVTLTDRVVPGDLSFYVAGQWDGSDLDRQAVGAEYARDFAAGGSVFASAEYDLKFSQVNRVQISGNTTLGNGDRVSASAAYYRSPTLSLENALYGQIGVTIDDLRLFATEQEIEDFARDQSSKVATASVIYSTRLNPRWNLAADASVFHIEGPPGSVLFGVNGVGDLGTRVYVGGTVTGSSVFMKGDAVNLGLRYSKGSDDHTISLDASVYVPVTDDFSVRPRIRVGKRMNENGEPDDNIVMGSVSARYSFDRTTSFQIDIGAKNEDTSEFFVNAGVSKSF